MISGRGWIRSEVPRGLEGLSEKATGLRAGQGPVPMEATPVTARLTGEAHAPAGHQHGGI